ncbi:hypothetical protein LCL96_01555 [Rossellomorea aquimaris]|uniref:hypothetical protein n=1 Tax=Rossellomorea aquimaris TaxID=189382 RepID=UPI001CD60A80|nr:hypothetical protein [Rossellomorea aquimaris]MCA1057601.1 hypothetical protein [Rossellomorea aquimaris]
MNPKEQIYYLLNEYSKGNYDTKTFCDQFTNIFNIEIDYEKLSDLEYRLFNNLSKVTARFSPYDEDLIFSNVYYNEQDIKREVLSLQEILIKGY